MYIWHQREVEGAPSLLVLVLLLQRGQARFRSLRTVVRYPLQLQQPRSVTDAAAPLRGPEQHVAHDQGGHLREVLAAAQPADVRQLLLALLQAAQREGLEEPIVGTGVLLESAVQLPPLPGHVCPLAEQSLQNGLLVPPCPPVGLHEYAVGVPRQVSARVVLRGVQRRQLQQQRSVLGHAELLGEGGVYWDQGLSLGGVQAQALVESPQLLPVQRLVQEGGRAEGAVEAAAEEQRGALQRPQVHELSAPGHPVPGDREPQSPAQGRGAVPGLHPHHPAAAGPEGPTHHEESEDSLDGPDCSHRSQVPPSDHCCSHVPLQPRRCFTAYPPENHPSERESHQPPP
mmetsp:Transcript_20217/g.44956  ORF Transcript_20217/g.44956 Transcript_20217/m.44956 type:complete len:343 (+) Transcript_20217:875-1903(+)